MNSNDGEQPRIATVVVTNAADTDEIQALIRLLENRFAVDARMADGELHVVSDTSEAGDVSAFSGIDEDQTQDVVWKGELSPQSGPDACLQRPQPEDDAEQTTDVDEQDVPDDEPEDDADESLTKREKRLQRLRQNVEDGEPYTSTELAAIAFDQDEDDVTSSAKAYVSGLRSELDIETIDDPRRDGNAKLYYRGDRPDVSVDESKDDTDDTDEDTSETVSCPHCGGEYAPKGLGPHKRSCPENPDNQDAADSETYRCGNCGEGFPTERGVQSHQNRSRDCTGADIERVEQTDDSDSAASAADPSGDHDEGDDGEDDDADLDPEVGAVPIDPDTVDEAVVEDDDDEPVPADEPDEDDKHRVRREPSTVREVVEAAVSGQYVCLECGFILDGSEDATAVKHHDFRGHEPYTNGNGDEYRQLAEVPDDELAERWLLTYKNVGSTWTHPRLHEARKNGIVSVLEEADYFLDATQIRERLNELLQASSSGHRGRRLSHEQLVDDPGYLDELVDEDRIEQDGRTWGVDAERAAKIVEATA